MKKYLFTLLFCLGTWLQLNAQDVIRIELKDGNEVFAPVTALQGMTYTKNASGVSSVFSENITVGCISPFTDEMTHQNTIPSFLTLQASDQLTRLFQGYSEVKMTNESTGKSADITLNLNKEGELSMYYGVGNHFTSALYGITGYDPQGYTLRLDVKALFTQGEVSFTKKATCSFAYNPNTLPVEDAYYLVGTHNNWKLTSPLIHAGDYKYDGQPFTLTIAAPRQNGVRVDEHLRIVPVSAINGDSYDATKTLGLKDELYSDIYDGVVYYSAPMDSGTGFTDIVLPADDGCSLYTIQYSPSWNYISIKGENATSLFERCYSNLGFTSPQKDANGGSDIGNLDMSTTSLIRQLVNLNDVTTDEMICRWLTDFGISELNFNSWDARTYQLEGVYSRLQKGVEYCNKYLLSEVGSQQEVAEVRFLRAYYNAQLLDLFGNVPVYKSYNDINPATMPRKQLFDYLIDELTICETDLAAPHSRTSGDADYERVDKAAAWMLMARLYLNAQVYTGTANWSKAAEYAKKVVDCGAYQLYTTAQNGWSPYQQLFMGDNGENGACRESLMTIAYDGENATEWGHVFLMAANYNSDVKATDGGDLGLSQQWTGIFALPQLPAKFFPDVDAPYVNTADMVSSAGDDRALFWGKYVNFYLQDLSNYQGYVICKYINRYAAGGNPKSQSFPDFDVFLMRYAETLLTLAEANLRMGNESAALSYLNQVRQRANATPLSSCTLQVILDEWTREFYQEGRHRIDLVRFGQYGGDTDYLWPWKGGTYEGTSFGAYRNVFPIPATVLESNPNAIQNPGY